MMDSSSEQPTVWRWPLPRLLALLLSALFTLSGCSAIASEDGRVISTAEYETRSQGLIDYFQKRQARYPVIATTRTASGQVIDWINPDSQLPAGTPLARPPVSGLKAAEKPDLLDGGSSLDNPYLDTALPRALTSLGRQESQALTELQLEEEEAMGPPGSVPIVRFDVEAYLKANPTFLPRDPLDVLSKVPPPAPASNDRYYAVWQRFADTFGTLGRINIWDTEGPVGNETSIAQTAVIRGTPMQAIEAGKIENSNFAPSRQPTLFTYYRTSGAASGDWVGGYNALVDGWIQVGRSVAPGMSLVPWNSRVDGSQYSLDVEVRLWEGNWWVRAAGEWAGYYPACIGGGSAPCPRGTLFSASGIRDKAERVDWYGEVFDASAPAATSTDMGSGRFADQRWGRAAYFRNLLDMWSPTQAWWWSSGAISTTDSACYSADGPYYSSDPNWRNWFYYGGPGREAKGCS